ARYAQPHPLGVAAETGEAIARAACSLAQYIGAKVLVAPTRTGSTARRVSKQRPAQPIVSLCPSPSVARALKLCWGVVPVIVRPARTTDTLIVQAEDAAKSLDLVHNGDRLVMTSGTPGVAGSTDLIKTITVNGSRRRSG
ncbi:MAG: pyruvate kinase, partial [Nitrososphaerota archaeon]|nr:pyruvate kinase [Nitrososphaerota archaeon]